MFRVKTNPVVSVMFLFAACLGLWISWKYWSVKEGSDVQRKVP